MTLLQFMSEHPFFTFFLAALMCQTIYACVCVITTKKETKDL